MQLWLKGLLLSVFAFGASWSSAIWYWRSTNRMPATGELATYLVALPLALLLACWAAAKGVAMWQARGAQAPAAPQQDDAAHAEAAPAAPAPALPQLHIAAAALRVPHGASAAELAEALAAHTARADLDSALQDDDGYPVMRARAAYIDEAMVQEAVQQWRQEAGQAPLAATPEFWRALALAAPVVDELALAATSHGALAGRDAAAAPAHSGAARQAIPTLQLALLLPSDWPAPWRDVAGQWLQSQAELAGWPRRHSAVTAYADTSPGALLAAMHGSALPCFTLLLACASHVGAATVHRWAEQRALFTAKHPQGVMPGEAAAGLLLASGEHAARLATGPAPVLAAVHARQGVHDGALLQLAQQALAQQQRPALIVADTGHRSARVMELMAAGHALLPQLDPTQDIATLGSATGHAGSAGELAALALAAHEAQARGAPVLCLTNEDPQQRCAALIRPAVSATPGT